MRTRIDRSTNPPTLHIREDRAIALTKINCHSDAVRRVEARGSHYFDSDTLHYFRAKFHAECPLSDGSILMVESTKRTGFHAPDGDREYRVMRVTLDGEIRHYYTYPDQGPNEKEHYPTTAGARRAMLKIRDAFEAASKKTRETPEIGGS